jgi:hypothetical protein
VARLPPVEDERAVVQASHRVGALFAVVDQRRPESDDPPAVVVLGPAWRDHLNLQSSSHCPFASICPTDFSKFMGGQTLAIGRKPQSTALVITGGTAASACSLFGFRMYSSRARIEAVADRDRQRERQAGIPASRHCVTPGGWRQGGPPRAEVADAPRRAGNRSGAREPRSRYAGRLPSQVQKGLEDIETGGRGTAATPCRSLFSGRCVPAEGIGTRGGGFI